MAETILVTGATGTVCSEVVKSYCQLKEREKISKRLHVQLMTVHLETWACKR